MAWVNNCNRIPMLRSVNVRLFILCYDDASEKVARDTYPDTSCPWATVVRFDTSCVCSACSAPACVVAVSLITTFSAMPQTARTAVTSTASAYDTCTQSRWASRPLRHVAAHHSSRLGACEMYKNATALSTIARSFPHARAAALPGYKTFQSGSVCNDGGRKSIKKDQ